MTLFSEPYYPTKYPCLKALLFALVALLLFGTRMAAAQNRDSITRLINAHPTNDTTKVNLLSELALCNEASNPDAMIAAAREGLALSGEINYTKGKALCLQELGYAHLSKNIYDSALYYYEKALPLFEQTGDTHRQCNVLHHMAITYYRLMKYSLSLEYFNRIIQISERTNDHKTAAEAIVYIGGIYSDLGNYAEALNNYLRGLKTYEKLGFKEGVAICLRNIADVYSLMGENKKALEYINKSIAINEVTDNKQGMIANYVAVGSVYGQMNDFSSALFYFKKGFRLADSLGNDFWKNNCLANIAESYYGLKNYDSAYAKYSEGLEEANKAKDVIGAGYDYKGIGSIMVKKGRAKEGIQYLLKAFGIMQKNGMKQPALEASKMLAEAYEALHDYTHALEFNKIVYSYKDSLYNEKNDKRVQQLQFDYELSKKESQISLLNKDQIIAQSRNEQQKVATWALFAGLAFLLIIAVVLYRGRVYEKKNRKKVLKQKEEIQQQAAGLESLNKFKDKTFSVLSHDLRSPLGSFATTMALLDEEMITQEEFISMQPALRKQLNSLNSLLDSMLKWAASYMTGQMMAKPETIGLRDATSNNISLLLNTAQRKGIAVNNNIPQSMFARCDPGQYDIIIRNLIMNAIKYTTANTGVITLSAVRNADNIEIAITDNGTGMTTDQLDALFTTKPVSALGTEGEKGLGMGLLLCYEFIKANNGTISVTSAPGSGTTFTVTLPAATALS